MYKTVLVCSILLAFVQGKISFSKMLVPYPFIPVAETHTALALSTTTVTVVTRSTCYTSSWDLTNCYSGNRARLLREEPNILLEDGRILKLSEIEPTKPEQVQTTAAPSLESIQEKRRIPFVNLANIQSSTEEDDTRLNNRLGRWLKFRITFRTTTTSTLVFSSFSTSYSRYVVFFVSPCTPDGWSFSACPTDLTQES